MTAEFDLAEFPVKDTLRMISSVLRRITRANDALYTPESRVTRFHARTIPRIDIYNYLTRIQKYAPCGNECFLAVLVYFDRIATSRKHRFVINSYNIHRLLISSIMVATKFYSDIFYTNSHYAKVGGLSPTELNSLELEFLFLNEFYLTIQPEEFQKYGDQLLHHAMLERSVADRSQEEASTNPSPAVSQPAAPQAPPPPQQQQVPPQTATAPTTESQVAPSVHPPIHTKQSHEHIQSIPQQQYHTSRSANTSQTLIQPPQTHTQQPTPPRPSNTSAIQSTTVTRNPSPSQQQPVSHGRTASGAMRPAQTTQLPTPQQSQTQVQQSTNTSRIPTKPQDQMRRPSNGRQPAVGQHTGYPTSSTQSHTGSSAPPQPLPNGMWNSSIQQVPRAQQASHPQQGHQQRIRESPPRMGYNTSGGNLVHSVVGAPTAGQPVAQAGHANYVDTSGHGIRMMQPPHQPTGGPNGSYHETEYQIPNRDRGTTEQHSQLHHHPVNASVSQAQQLQQSFASHVHEYDSSVSPYDSAPIQQSTYAPPSSASMQHQPLQGNKYYEAGMAQRLSNAPSPGDGYVNGMRQSQHGMSHPQHQLPQNPPPQQPHPSQLSHQNASQYNPITRVPSMPQQQPRPNVVPSMQQAVGNFPSVPQQVQGQMPSGVGLDYARYHPKQIPQAPQPNAYASYQNIPARGVPRPSLSGDV